AGRAGCRRPAWCRPLPGLHGSHLPDRLGAPLLSRHDARPLHRVLHLDRHDPVVTVPMQHSMSWVPMSDIEWRISTAIAEAVSVGECDCGDQFVECLTGGGAVEDDSGSCVEHVLNG